MTDRDEIAKICNDEITARFRSIGIYDQDDAHLEDTRANFRLVQEIRLAREKSKGAYKRLLLQLFSGSGQILWVTLLAALTWLIPLIVKAILRAVQ